RAHGSTVPSPPHQRRGRYRDARRPTGPTHVHLVGTDVVAVEPTPLRRLRHAPSGNEAHPDWRHACATTDHDWPWRAACCRSPWSPPPAPAVSAATPATSAAGEAATAAAARRTTAAARAASPSTSSPSTSPR